LLRKNYEIFTRNYPLEKPLGQVTCYFRELAEKAVLAIEKKIKAAGGASQNLEKVEDLEVLDTPVKALRLCFQGKEERLKQKTEKEHLQALRFLFNTYKQILDVFKSNAKSEKLYHQTIEKGLEFCVKYERVSEFKRLCDIIRNNYLNLFKRTTPNPFSVDPNDEETVHLTIKSRLFQLRKAGDLKLWKECFNTAEDLHSLMMKVKRKPQYVAEYYKFLSSISWKSKSFLWHSRASLRNFVLYKEKKNFSKEDRLEMASKAVLATLCVPDEAGKEQQNLVLGGQKAQQEYEKQRHMAS